MKLTIDNSQLLIALMGLAVMLIPSFLLTAFKHKHKLIKIAINISIILIGLINIEIAVALWSTYLVYIVTSKPKDKNKMNQDIKEESSEDKS